MNAGRKRAFDETEALQAAMEVFWQKGYTGASLSELTEKMGINKPSMYSAFGNKEELFIKATKRYIDIVNKTHGGFLYESGVPFNIRLKNYMKSVVSMQCESDNPKGCFVVLCQSELAGGDMPEEAGRLLTEAGGYSQKLFEEIFLDDPESKKLGLNKDARRNALCLTTMLHGTASMARAGTPLKELEYVIDQSLNAIGIH